MIAVRVMQVTIHQIIGVIAVRHRLVPASRPMHVPRRMSGTPMLRRAAVGIARRDLDHVLVDVIAVGMMQVTVVKIVHMVAVPNGLMAAIGTVLVRVIGMVRAGARGH
jgi:hypothetical protein